MPCGRTPRRSFSKRPSNPTLEVIDIAEVAKIAHPAGAMLVVDNVFATPLLQKPLALGADWSSIPPPSISTGRGAVWAAPCWPQTFHQRTRSAPILIRHTGPSLSPFNAWVLLKGLETLAVRVRRQTDSAATVAVALASIRRLRA